MSDSLSCEPSRNGLLSVHDEPYIHDQASLNLLLGFEPRLKRPWEKEGLSKDPALRSSRPMDMGHVRTLEMLKCQDGKGDLLKWPESPEIIQNPYDHVDHEKCGHGINRGLELVGDIRESAHPGHYQGNK